MKIKDAAHAVRVLEALIEQGERGIPAGGYSCWASAPLIEGAKAVLEEHKEISIDAADWETLGGAERVILSLAQAYAPRMEQAGMKVPE